MERLGIIDIGSNSIRAVIYELTDNNAYRVIDEAKESARLSERLEKNGTLSEADLQYIVSTLQRFRSLCEQHGVTRLRAVATAAIRNSPNSGALVKALTERAGLPIEVLPGEEEARLGFLGTVNSMDLEDGFTVDIGGGSTEVLLFRRRSIVRSVSFPFGAVNTLRQFGSRGELDDDAVDGIAEMVTRAVSKEASWIASNPGLPLIGLGGTVRSLCKMDQRERHYSLPITHHYQMDGEASARWIGKLRSMTFAQRKRIEGLSKGRADIIVPGLIILDTLFRLTGASQYIVSGAGLRDGIFFELLRPEAPQFSNALDHSVYNLLALHPSVSLKQMSHIERLAMKLYRGLRAHQGWDDRIGACFHAAALLHRIGVTVNYYHIQKHTYYLLAHSRMNGLTHREILLCALIASYKSEKKLKPLFAEHRDVLEEPDYRLILHLGSLLQLAAALDRSTMQRVVDVSIRAAETEMRLNVVYLDAWDLEKRELSSLAKEFGKIWGMKLFVEETPASEA